MKLRFKFLLLLLPFLLLPSFVKAEEKTLTGEWKQIEAGTSIISLEKKGEFIEQLEAKIKALTDASIEDGTVYDYSYIVKKEYEEQSKSYNTVEVSKLFATKAEAEEYYKALEVKGKMNPKYRELFSDEFEVVCEEDCEKEIVSDYVCRINEIEYKTVKQTFKKIEEADAYDDTVEGYKLVSKTVTPETTSVTYTLENKYHSKRDAKKAIKDFEKLYGVESTHSITYARDTSKDVGPTTTLGTTPYYTEAEAKAIKDALDAEVFDGERTVTLRKESEIKTVTYDIGVSETFASPEDAEAALVELEAAGYTILNRSSVIVEKYGVSPTMIKKETPDYVIDGPGPKEEDKIVIFEVPGDTNFIVLKQGNGKIAVWTPTPLTDKSLFLDAFNSNPDSSIDINSVEIKYIDGYGEKNLKGDHESGWNEWGKYTFYYNFFTGKINMSCKMDKISHIDYGKFGSSKYYAIEGKMTREELVDVWYVDKVELLFGYSYYAKATITLSTTVYNAVYEYERKTMKCSDPSYALSYEVENITYKNYAEIEWFIGSQFLGSGGTTPPNTNLYVEATSYTKYFMISFIGILILLKSRKYIFNK